MSPETSGAPAATSIARLWFEQVWNARNDEAIDRLAEPEAFAHLETGTSRGMGAFRRAREELLSGLPDMHVELEEVVVSGENEIVRWRARGTFPPPGCSGR